MQGSFSAFARILCKIKNNPKLGQEQKDKVLSFQFKNKYLQFVMYGSVPYKIAASAAT